MQLEKPQHVADRMGAALVALLLGCAMLLFVVGPDASASPDPGDFDGPSWTADTSDGGSPGHFPWSGWAALPTLDLSVVGPSATDAVHPVAVIATPPQRPVLAYAPKLPPPSLA